MRAFVAIEVGDAVSVRLGEEVTRLRRLAPEARWMKPASFHLTLSFLGEIPDAEVPGIGTVLRSCASRHEPMTLEAGGGGTFGRLTSPQVLWVAIGGELERLAALQAELAKELSLLGYVPDFPTFQPHLTLARTRRPRGDIGLARCSDALREVRLGAFEVREVVLCSSEDRPAGMHHRPVLREPLGGPVPGPS